MRLPLIVVLPLFVASVGCVSAPVETRSSNNPAIDVETLFEAANEAGNCIITVEDHWPEGGLGEAVLEAFTGRDGALPRIVKLAVQSMPGSGTPAELMEEAGISAHDIVQSVRALVRIV